MSTSSANDEQATAPGTTARFPRGLSSRWADWLTAGSVVLVVVLVSVPMLHGVARRENEHDAHTTLALFAETLERVDRPVLDLAALLERDPSLRRRLPDAEIEVKSGRGLVRRHGYLFDAVTDQDGEWVLRAWPWAAGHSGELVLFCRAGERPRSFADEGRSCSGPYAPPSLKLLRAGLPRGVLHAADSRATQRAPK